MENIRIIQYEEKYKNEIIRFVEKVAIDEYGYYNWKKDIDNMFFDIYKEKLNKFFIALNNCGEIIGTCAGLKQTNEIIKLNTFYVAKEYRKHGIGTKLYDKLIEHSKINGFCFIELSTYKKLNLAIRFYEEKGFKLYKMVGEACYYRKEI